MCRNRVENVENIHKTEQKKVDEYTKEDLEEKLKTAYNIEARAGHKKEHPSTTMIGTVRRKNKLYDVYQDSDGNYWYAVRFATDRGAVSEFEYIFGHPERKQEKKRR